MCRFAAYTGTSRPLSSLLYDPPHSLEHQAYAPQHLRRGHVNVDGTGVAWWPEGAIEPLRFISERPPWSDPNLPHLSRRLEATTAIAAVRSATPGVGFGPGHVQPFLADDVAFTHNGWVQDWRGGVGRDIVERLPDDLHAQLDTSNDSKAIFLHVVALLRSGADPGEALVGAARLVADLAAKRDVGAALTMCLAGRNRLVAIRTSVATDQNTLFWSAGSLGRCIASEPLDPSDSWVAVAEDHIVEARPGATSCAPLSEVF